MSSNVQKIVGIASVVIVGVLLWPVFAAGESWLLAVLVAFLIVGGTLGFLALRKGSKRTVRYALLGIIPGFLIGGIGVGVIARLANAGSDGWEDLVALVLAIFGSFVGAVVGAFVGAILGWRADKRAQAR